MRKTIVVLVLLIIVAFDFSIAQEKPLWDYPVKSGTKEWATFKTHQEMLDVCQIPENLLKAMNTSDLIKICLNYPLIGDVYAYSNIKNGIENVSKQFNGFAELFIRNDNFSFLMSELERRRLLLNDNLTSNKSDAEKGEIILIFTIVEALLSFDDVLSNSDYNQKQKLISVVDEILSYKLKNGDKFGGLSITSTAFLLGKTLQKTNKLSKMTPDTESFLNNNFIATNSVIDEIMQAIRSSK